MRSISILKDENLVISFYIQDEQNIKCYKQLFNRLKLTFQNPLVITKRKLKNNYRTNFKKHLVQFFKNKVIQPKYIICYMDDETTQGQPDYEFLRWIRLRSRLTLKGMEISLKYKIVYYTQFFKVQS